MAAAKKKSSVVTVRAKDTIALPAAILGYSDLVKPYSFDGDEDEATFRANLHYAPPGIEALKRIIAEKVYTKATLDKLAEEAEENGLKMGKPQDPEAWLEAKLKEPAEKSPVKDLPFLLVANKATYKKKGEIVERVISAWDQNNRVLPLDKLRLSAGSVIEAIVYPNVFLSKLIGFPQPSLKLVGVRILQLKQYQSGGAAPADKDDKAIKEVLGEGFVADDLSRFLQQADDEGDDEATPPNPGGMF